MVLQVFSSAGISIWYIDLNKPFLNPPAWIFGPVWTVLYILMGIASYLVFSKKILFLNKKKKLFRKNSLYIYFLQLVLNFLWSFLFFYFHSPLLALINIVSLWVMILTCILMFYKIHKTAGLLLIPYLLWVSFASYLNFMIFYLN